MRNLLLLLLLLKKKKKKKKKKKISQILQSYNHLYSPIGE